MKYLLLSLLLLATNCATPQNSVESDVANALALLGHQRDMAYPDTAPDFICRELRPISDVSVKNYLTANSHRYQAYAISAYFGRQDDLKLLPEEIYGKTLISDSLLEDIFLSTPKTDFWTLYREKVGVSGYRKAYLPLYNKDRSQFILYVEEGHYGANISGMLLQFARQGGKLEMKKVILSTT